MGHKRYHSIRHMLHKLSESMDKRDDEYVLASKVELGDEYCSTEISEKKILIETWSGQSKANKSFSYGGESSC